MSQTFLTCITLILNWPFTLSTGFGKQKRRNNEFFALKASAGRQALWLLMQTFIDLLVHFIDMDRTQIHNYCSCLQNLFPQLLQVLMQNHMENCVKKHQLIPQVTSTIEAEGDKREMWTPDCLSVFLLVFAPQLHNKLSFLATYPVYLIPVYHEYIYDFLEICY